MISLVLLALMGCDDGSKGIDSDVDTEIDSDTLGEPDTDPDTQGCPALAVTAEPAALNPQQRGIVRIQSGQEPFRFRLEQSDTGAIVSDVTGEYLSGEGTGVDTIVVTDACGQQADASFTVIPRLIVQPTEVTMPPQTPITLLVSGGSQDVSCVVEFDRSGGVLNGCRWTSGTSTGTDVIQVVDGVTGDFVRAALSIREDASLQAPELVVALRDNPVDIPILGGSGLYDLRVTRGDDFVVDGTSVDPTFPGEAYVTIEDRFLAELTTTSRIVVAEPLSPAPQIDGVTDSYQPVVTADLNNDGFTDAVVSQYNANTGIHRGGVVMVYLGTATGLDPIPVQVFEGTWRFGFMGRSLAVGDLSGDGIADLVIGEEQFRNSIGRVTIYTGNGDGSFSTQPWFEKLGEFGGDRMGTGVAVCDIDADGGLDLVVSSRTRDDRTVSPFITDVGVVNAYAASPLGLSDDPIWSAFGVDIDGDAFISSRQQLGRNVRTGDVDGDGRCDVVSSLTLSDTVVVYASTDASDGELLPSLPSRLYRAETGHEDLDWSLEVADLDDDGLDDVIAGGWRTDGIVSNRSGGAYVFFAADDDGRPATQPVLRGEFSVAVVGSEGNEELGVSVGVADVNDDGALDLFVGGVRTDSEVNNAGGVQWFDGTALAEAELGDTMSEVDAMGAIYGNESEGGFGVGVGFLPHVQGWVVVEGRSNHLGPRVGDVYLDTVEGRTALSWPYRLGGAVVGTDDTMTLFDDGGTEPTLLVAAPLDSLPPNYVDIGQVAQISETTQSNWYEVPDASGPSIPDNRAGMQTGWRIAGVGDVDGDGAQDLGVIQRQQRDRPDLYADAVDNPEECRSGSGNTGMIAVYRGGQAAGQPDYLVYGPTAGARIERLAAGDMNGDGLGDVVFTSTLANPDSMTIAYGRPLGEQSVILCDQWSLAPRPEGESFGYDLLSLGDVDDDGCDDVAVSAPNADPGGANRGAVWVLFGWGDRCATDSPRATGLAGPLNNSRMGFSMGIADVTGDGVRELMIGAPDNGNGRVYQYRTDLLAQGARPVDGAFEDADVLVSDIAAEGLQAGGSFGRALTVVEGEGLPWLAVGEPFYDVPTGVDGLDPVFSIGRVHLLRHDGTRMRASGLVGLDESHDPRNAQGGELGYGLVSVGGTLLIGAPRSSNAFTENGAVYRVDLD